MGARGMGVLGYISHLILKTRLPAGLQSRYKDTPKKKATLASGPKFREETPKKGSDKTTPIAISHCNNYAALHKTQA
jgi:hypothetical protein